jgi:hypothetical protein
MTLGIMAFTEAGKVHRDISPYNLLLVNPEKHYEGLDWLEPVEVGPKFDVWNRTETGIHAGTEDKLSDPEPKVE